MLNIRFCIPHLTLNKPSDNIKSNTLNSKNKLQSNPSILLEKNIFCRNISVECTQVKYPTDQLTQFFTLILNSPLTSLVINPFHTEINISIVNNLNDKNQVNLSPHLSQASSILNESLYHLHLSVKLSNLEFTPTIQQLSFLNESCCYIIQISRKYQYLLLRPNSNPSRSQNPNNNNIRQWWKYALISVLIKKNGKSIFYPKNNWSLGYDSSPIDSKTSLKYIELYLKYLQYQSFQNLLASSNSSSSISSQIELNLKKYQLDSNEIEILENFNRTLNWSTLLVLRLLSHRKLREINSRDIPLLKNNNSFWTSFVSTFSSSNNSSDYIPLFQNIGNFF